MNFKKITKKEQIKIFKHFKNFSSIVIIPLLITIVTLILQLSFFSCDSSHSSDIIENSDIIEKDDLILVCGDSKVFVINYVNYKDSIPQIIWSWDAHYANDLPSQFRIKKFNSIDDCKSMNNGKQIVVSSSSGAIAIVNIKDKKVVFYADVPNAHSIEILPGNKIVAAASTAEKGNRLMLFDISNPSKLLFSDSLYSAHGVVWDENRNSLFSLGYDVLREYKIEDEIKLVLKDEWKIPGISGHDLQKVPDEDSFFITDSSGAWIFNVGVMQFNKIKNFPDAKNIKSLNQNKKGRYVYTIPEDSWWTHHVRFYNPEGILIFPNIHVYKVRWF